MKEYPKYDYMITLKFQKKLYICSCLDRPKTGVVFETCQGNEEPIIFTGHSRNLWVDFVADHNSSGRGFQISFLTIDGE